MQHVSQAYRLTKKSTIVVFATGLLFLTLLQNQTPRSFVFDSTVEKNKTKLQGLNLSSPNETPKNDEENDSVWPMGNITTVLSTGENNTFPLITTSSNPTVAELNINQTLEIDSAYPLFFKDGLQRICSNSEDQDFIVESQSASRPANHTFKCLTVSEDGTSFIFTALNSSSLSNAMENGDAVLFGAGIDRQTRNDSWFGGQLMNRLIELRNALSHTASCGKLIILPRTLSNDDPESWGEFDCADFRRMGHPKLDSIVASRTTADESVEFPRLLQPNKTQTIVDTCSILFPDNGGYWLFYVPSKLDFILNFKKRFDAAHRIVLAWWGLGPGYFRCNACSESDQNLTVAWLRSGDVFHRRHPSTQYGQPPLEYYIQSIRQSGASDVLLLSQGGIRRTRRIDSNPLVSALSKFDFGSKIDSSSHIHLSVVLGEPFYTVLRRLFCARVAILGVSTLSTMLTFSPNVQTIFLAKPWIYSQALEYGTADIYFYDVGVSRSMGLEFENTTLKNNVEETNYSVYQNWINSPEQREEMLSYQGGTLKPLLLHSSKSRNMT